MKDVIERFGGTLSVDVHAGWSSGDTPDAAKMLYFDEVACLFDTSCASTTVSSSASTCVTSSTKMIQVADEPQKLEASSFIPAPPPLYQEYIYHDFQTGASRPYYHHLVNGSTTWTPDGPFYKAFHAKDRVKNRAANDGEPDLKRQLRQRLSSHVYAKGICPTHGEKAHPYTRSLASV